MYETIKPSITLFITAFSCCSFSFFFNYYRHSLSIVSIPPHFGAPNRKKEKNSLNNGYHEESVKQVRGYKNY